MKEIKIGKIGGRWWLAICGMRAHLMHVFPHVILFVEDCQQVNSATQTGHSIAGAVCTTKLA